MSLPLRPAIPAPLPCALVVASLIALFPPSPYRLTPSGATADDRGNDRISGTVGGPLVRTPRGVGAPLHTDGSTVWLWSEIAISPGDVVVATGRLKTPRGFANPGMPDRAAMVDSRGAKFELSATTVVKVGQDGGVEYRIWRWATETQRAWGAAIEATDGDEPAGRAALRGIVTGERGDVPPELDARWRAVGIYHVLSVSGLHLAVVALLAFALLRKLVAASPIGGRCNTARWAAPPAIVLAVAYTLVTGAQLATLRSLIVVAIVLVAKMLDRPLRLVDALGLAAIVILCWCPQDLRDPSFQLSFVAALTLAVRPQQARAVGRRARAWQWLSRGLLASLWVTIATAPITAYHFHQISAGGIAGNLVLTPVLELVALPLGLAGLLVSSTSLLSLAVWVVARVDDLAGVLVHVAPVGNVSLGSPIVAAMLVALGVFLASRERRTRVETCAWLALCTAWTFGRTPPAPGALRVTFLDVGQGDAAIVELPDGTVWLVDAGGIASAPDLAAATAPGKVITRTLGVYGHDAIDLAIVSHPHPDHYLGLLGLEVPIRELWTIDEHALPAPRQTDPRSFAHVEQLLVFGGTRVRHPPLGTTQHGGVELVVWGPRYQASVDAAPIEAADPVRGVNDNSLVVELRYAGRSILMTGDVEAEGEHDLLAAGLGAVDVVKVAHHGSPTSSSAAFVAATRPEVAVISCGRANAFGFPSAAVIDRWRTAGAAVERTDTSGAVTVTIDSDGSLATDRFLPAVW